MKIERVIFLSAFDYPSRYAHALHGLHMARALANMFGSHFIFFVNTAVDTNVLTGVRYQLLFGAFGRRIKKMRLRRVLVPISFLWSCYLHSEWRGVKTVLYVTDPVLYSVARTAKRFFGFSVVAECHGSISDSQMRSLSAADKIVSVTEGLKNDILQKYPLREKDILVVPNAVDIRVFENVTSDRRALRKELDLPECFLVGYIGRFEPLGYDKGLRFMIDTLQNLPVHVHLLLVGGTKNEVERYRGIVDEVSVQERVHIVGHVEQHLVPRYAKACDVLAYVPTESNVFFERETSPMKIFEYMAAQRPIVISDMPALRTILPTEAVYVISPGSRSDFTDTLRNIWTDTNKAQHRAQAAFKLALHNTWEKRAGVIVHTLESML